MLLLGDGWDNQVGLRKCVKCKGGVVTLHEMIGYGPLTGVFGVGGLVLWRLFGVLLGGMIVCLFCSFCGLITLLTMRYKCGNCGKGVQGRTLSADEKGLSRKRRLGYLIGMLGLAAAAVVLGLMFVAYMNARS
jgi:hypothetical protein